MIRVAMFCGLHSISVGQHYYGVSIFVFGGQVRYKTGLSISYLFGEVLTSE